MLFSAPGNPTKIKKAIYLFVTTVLGVMISFLVHAFIEIVYLRWAESRGVVVDFYNNCALSPVLQNSILLLGIVGGFLLGRVWWRKVYVERVWVKSSK